MTAPLDAYISVVARDCYREMARRFPGEPNAIICGRHDGYLIIVAKGHIARELEKTLNAKIDPKEKP